MNGSSSARSAPRLRVVHDAQQRERWAYLMLNPAQQKAVLQAIIGCPKPLTTLKVWNAAIAAIDYDRGGAIAASASEIAEIADVPAQEASRALGELAKIGALSRTGRGKYKINPHVGWSGNLDERELAAARSRPVLRLVEPVE